MELVYGMTYRAQILAWPSVRESSPHRTHDRSRYRG